MPLKNKTQRWKVYLTAAEERELQRAAKREGLHVSELVRDCSEDAPNRAKPSAKQLSLMKEKAAGEPPRPQRVEVRLLLKLHAKAIAMGQSDARALILSRVRK